MSTKKNYKQSQNKSIVELAEEVLRLVQKREELSGQENYVEFQRNLLMKQSPEVISKVKIPLEKPDWEERSPEKSNFGGY